MSSKTKHGRLIRIHEIWNDIPEIQHEETNGKPQDSYGGSLYQPAPEPKRYRIFRKGVFKYGVVTHVDY